MKRPFVSVIIPNYNSARTIKSCVESVLSTDYASFECIVVDDCSTDNSVELIKGINCRIIRLKKNSGPATARNAGVKHSKGDIVFFVDSDLILKPNAIAEVVKTFDMSEIAIRKLPASARGKKAISEHAQEHVPCFSTGVLDKNKEIGGVQGIYSSIPANKTFIGKIMAIKKFTDFDGSKKLTFITGAITALRKDVFNEAGGFDIRYRGADVEDYDLGHKIAEKHLLLYNPNIQGEHYFPTLIKACKNYFKRSGQWVSIFRKRKRFDSGAASKKGGLSAIVSVLIILSLIISLFMPYVFILFFSLLLLFLVLNSKFLKKAITQEGTIFTLESIPVLCILFNAALLGAAFSFIRMIVGRNR